MIYKGSFDLVVIFFFQLVFSRDMYRQIVRLGKFEYMKRGACAFKSRLEEAIKCAVGIRLVQGIHFL